MLHRVHIFIGLFPSSTFMPLNKWQGQKKLIGFLIHRQFELVHYVSSHAPNDLFNPRISIFSCLGLGFFNPGVLLFSLRGIELVHPRMFKFYAPWYWAIFLSRPRLVRARISKSLISGPGMISSRDRVYLHQEFRSHLCQGPYWAPLS